MARAGSGIGRYPRRVVNTTTLGAAFENAAIVSDEREVQALLDAAVARLEGAIDRLGH